VGAFTCVERIRDNSEGGARLLAAANTVGVTRLVGLFGGVGGNIEYRQADGSGHNLENPMLDEMAAAALTVLERDPNGFVLMIEGGSVDWAAHGNNMDRVVGEMIGFNLAVQSVVDWVENGNNGSNWDNTLVIITGDHETGYLAAGPGIFPDQPLGTVSNITLGLEKTITSTGRRSSWEDDNGNNEIDAGETIFWAWNSGTHTNTLIPLYAKGVGAELFADFAIAPDRKRGTYLDNTDVHMVMDAVLHNSLPVSISMTGVDAQLEWLHTTPHTSYEIRQATSPYFDLFNSTAELITTLPAPPDSITYTHIAAGGSASENYFYEVRAFKDDVVFAISDQLGIFTFSLTPGG